MHGQKHIKKIVIHHSPKNKQHLDLKSIKINKPEYIEYTKTHGVSTIKSPSFGVLAAVELRIPFVLDMTPRHTQLDPDGITALISITHSCRPIWRGVGGEGESFRSTSLTFINDRRETV